jgi:hypothetical protein
MDSKKTGANQILPLHGQQEDRGKPDTYTAWTERRQGQTRYFHCMDSKKTGANQILPLHGQKEDRGKPDSSTPHTTPCLNFFWKNKKLKRKGNMLNIFNSW